MARRVLATNGLNARISPGSRVTILLNKDGTYSIVSAKRSFFSQRDAEVPEREDAPTPEPEDRPEVEREPTIVEGVVVKILPDGIRMRRSSDARVITVKNALDRRLTPGHWVTVNIDDNGVGNVIGTRASRFGRSSPAPPVAEEESEEREGEAAEEYFNGTVIAIRPDAVIVLIREL